MKRPRIAITMGDPAGIGPEISLRLLASPEILDVCIPIVFGDAEVLRRAASVLALPTTYDVLSEDEWLSECGALVGPTVIDFQAMDLNLLQPGKVNEATGGASYRYIEASIDAARLGQVDAVTTGPIHKEAINAAGVRYPGHTEIYIAKTNTQQACMMLTCDELTCSFVTTHVGYRDVPGLLTQDRIIEVIQLSHNAMLQMRGRTPKLIVCALNPHGGENGLFGDREEERIIIPAIEQARELGFDVEGPLPPDTAFLPARRRETDCFVCMYHDQGHIPLKALAFDIAVNVTLGLPIIRTSVDHGTALDIAWKGKAGVTSLDQAVRLAAQLAKAEVAAQQTYELPKVS